MRKHEELLAEKAAVELKKVLVATLGEGNKKFLYEKAIGKLLTEFNFKDSGPMQNHILGESLNEYVAESLGPFLGKLALLVDFLESKGASPLKPYDFNHADRYAAMLESREPDVRLAAFQTQALTYLVRLEKVQKYSEEGLAGHSWNFNLRYCTKGKYQQDFSRPAFTSFTAQELEPYFQFEDGRDQGFMCTMRADILGDGFTVKDTTWASFKMFQGLMYDLYCHTTRIDAYEKGEL